MDWIKMRANLRDDPAVWTIAKALKMDAFGVIGRLHAMWAWFDAHATADDPFVAVSPEAMDDHLRCQGWCDAVSAAGWLILHDDRLGVPNFARHMGASAKERAMSSVRVAKHRTNTTSGIYRETQQRSCNGHVTVRPLQVADSCNGNVTVGALHAKAIQDNTLSCNGPTVTSPLQKRYQREERRGERVEGGEVLEATPPNLFISSNQIHNSRLSRLEEFVDKSPEERAVALADYTARIEAFKRQQQQQQEPREQPAGSPRGLVEGVSDEQRRDGGDTGEGPSPGGSIGRSGAGSSGGDRGRVVGHGRAGRGIHDGQPDSGHG